MMNCICSAGLDYMHGTGHGVGSFLNVHEGPCGILSRERPGEIGLGENMILSNEPGYYEPGLYCVVKYRILFCPACSTFSTRVLTCTVQVNYQ